MERKVLLDVEIQTSEAVKASAALQVQIDGLRKSQKDLTKSFNEGEISTEEYSVALTKNKAQITFLSKEQSSYNREIQNTTKIANEAKDSYNQLSAQYSKNKDELNRMSAVQRLSTERGQQLEAETKAIYQQMQSLQEATGKYTLSVGNYEAAIQNVLGENTAFSNTLQGMQERLRTLTELMQGADVGSKAFKDAQDEAGKLRVQIDQALGKVDEFGDREPKNPLKKAYEDAFESATGLISGIELLNLSMGENDDVAQLQAKATKAVAIAQNLQNIARAKGAIIDTAANIKTKALTISQAAYTAVVGTSTGAMKLFRIALASTGVGALVIGLGLLITNFDKVKKVVLGAFPGLAAVGNVIGGIVTKVTDFVTGTTEQQRKAAKEQEENNKKYKKSIDDIDRDIELNGDKYTEVQKKKKQADRDYLQAYVDITENEKLTEQEKAKFLNDALAKQRRDKVNAEKEAGEELLKKQKENNEKYLAQQAEFNQNINEVQNQVNEGRINAIQDETQKAIEGINLREQNELKALENQYKEIQKYGKLNEEQEKLFAERRNQITAQAETDRMATFKSFQDESLQGKIAALDKERQAEIDIARATINNLELLQQEKLNIELRYQQKILELLSTQYAGANDEQKKALLTQIQNVQGLINTIQKNIDKQQETTQGQGTTALVLGMTPKQVDKTVASLQFVQQQFQQLGQIINSGFEARQNQIASEYQAQEEAIQNSTLSEKEKEKQLEALRKKRAMEEYEIAKEQFIVNQALNIGNTIIAGALAAIQAVAQLGPVAGAVAAGLIAASTAASIAVIATQPPPPKPQFYEGGFTEQSGNPRAVSKKSNQYRDVHHNEYIVPYKVLRNPDAMPLVNTLERMRQGTFGTLGLRGFADGGFSTRSIENAAFNNMEVANMVVKAVSSVNIVTKVTDINREQNRAVVNKVRSEI